MSHKRRTYPSDLTEEQWKTIREWLPLEWEGPGRPLELDLREVVNAILYVARTGCQWEYLPHDFPNYNSVFYHYRKWCRDGTWRRINRLLRQYEREQRGRKPDPTAGIIDTQSVKTTEAGGVRGYDAGKKVVGRKRHIVVDTVGNVLDVVVHPASVQDYHGAKEPLQKVTEYVSTLQKLWADGIYIGGDLIEWALDVLGITIEVVKRPRGQKGFQPLPRRWVVERTFAWLGRYRRLSKDYEHCPESSEGMIYIASIHTMLKRIVPAA